jgi:hypothetical protein
VVLQSHEPAVQQLASSQCGRAKLLRYCRGWPSPERYVDRSDRGGDHVRLPEQFKLVGHQQTLQSRTIQRNVKLSQVV